MNDYLLLMHSDAPDGGGGSAIGTGVCCNKSGRSPDITSHLCGYLRIQAESLADARKVIEGNPVFETGGTVEIRELPRSE